MHEEMERCPTCNEPMKVLFHTDLYCPACERDEERARIEQDATIDGLIDWEDISKEIDDLFKVESVVNQLAESLVNNQGQAHNLFKGVTAFLQPVNFSRIITLRIISENPFITIEYKILASHFATCTHSRRIEIIKEGLLYTLNDLNNNNLKKGK